MGGGEGVVNCLNSLLLKYPQRTCWLINNYMSHLVPPWRISSFVCKVRTWLVSHFFFKGFWPLPIGATVVSCLQNVQQWSAVFELHISFWEEAVRHNHGNLFGMKILGTYQLRDPHCVSVMNSESLWVIAVVRCLVSTSTLYTHQRLRRHRLLICIFTWKWLLLQQLCNCIPVDCRVTPAWTVAIHLQLAGNCKTFFCRPQWIY